MDLFCDFTQHNDSYLLIKLEPGHMGLYFYVETRSYSMYKQRATT